MSKKDKYLQNKYQKRNYLKENLHRSVLFCILALTSVMRHPVF